MICQLSEFWDSSEFLGQRMCICMVLTSTRAPCCLCNCERSEQYKLFPLQRNMPSHVPLMNFLRSRRELCCVAREILIRCSLRSQSQRQPATMSGLPIYIHFFQFTVFPLYFLPQLYLSH